MIIPSHAFKIYIAAEPVDFRKGLDGLAGHVQNAMNLDPYCGALFIFRSKRADRLKAILWGGTGFVLVHKRLESNGFSWPNMRAGTIRITKTQFEALFEGLDWRRISEPKLSRPSAA